MKNQLLKNIIALVFALFIYSVGFSQAPGTHPCDCTFVGDPCNDNTGSADCAALCTANTNHTPPICYDPVIPIDQNIIYLAGAALILGAYTIIKRRKRPTES